MEQTEIGQTIRFRSDADVPAHLYEWRGTVIARQQEPDSNAVVLIDWDNGQRTEEFEFHVQRS